MLDGRAKRMRTADELIQDNPKRKNIGCSCNLLTLDLLGTTVPRRTGSKPDRQILQTKFLVRLQNFRDSEIDQPGSAITGYKNVRGLKITMNDQVFVRVSNRGADLTKQFQNRSQIRLSIPAILFDGYAVDVLYYQIRQSVAECAAL